MYYSDMRSPDSSPVVFIQGAGRDGYRERERKVRWVGRKRSRKTSSSSLLHSHHPLFHLLYEDDWGRVSEKPVPDEHPEVNAFMEAGGFSVQISSVNPFGDTRRPDSGGEN